MADNLLKLYQVLVKLALEINIPYVTPGRLDNLIKAPMLKSVRLKQ